MPTKTGLIVSWNWTRGYGIIQEQQPTKYKTNDIIKIMKPGMQSYQEARVSADTPQNETQIEIWDNLVIGAKEKIDIAYVREKANQSGKQYFVHNANCEKKDTNAIGFGKKGESIGKERVWYNLWERVYFDVSRQNNAVNVTHKSNT